MEFKTVSFQAGKQVNGCDRVFDTKCHCNSGSFVPDDSDLGIYSEVPFLDSLQRGLTRLLTFLFLTKAASFAWDLGYVLVVSAVIGWQAWVHARSVTFGVCLMVILFLVFAVWGLLLTRTLPVLLRLQYGPPVFGALGGLPRRLFFLVVRCADAFKWAFAPEDLERVKTFGRIDRDVSEWSLKSAYHNVFAAKRPPELQDFEESWSHVCVKISSTWKFKWDPTDSSSSRKLWRKTISVYVSNQSS